MSIWSMWSTEFILCDKTKQKDERKNKPLRGYMKINWKAQQHQCTQKCPMRVYVLFVCVTIAKSRRCGNQMQLKIRATILQPPQQAHIHFHHLIKLHPSTSFCTFLFFHCSALFTSAFIFRQFSYIPLLSVKRSCPIVSSASSAFVLYVHIYVGRFCLRFRLVVCTIYAAKRLKLFFLFVFVSLGLFSLLTARSSARMFFACFLFCFHFHLSFWHSGLLLLILHRVFLYICSDAFARCCSSMCNKFLLFSLSIPLCAHIRMYSSAGCIRLHRNRAACHKPKPDIVLYVYLFCVVFHFFLIK